MNYVSLAKEWFAVLYMGDTATVGELAADDIVISYPIFQQVFDKPSLRGREAAQAFSARFVTKWAEGNIAFHDVIADGNKVVLLWTFRARNVGSLQEGQPPTNDFHTWGGITLLRFDDNGKVIEEVGEESSPGPFERLQQR